jgi:hypothetical protein
LQASSRLSARWSAITYRSRGIRCQFEDLSKRLNLVIAVDLTQSVSVTNPDAKSEFQKNIDGVARVLAQIPADAGVTVIGITDRSFAQP